MRPLLAALLIASATPALADTTFQCQQNSTMTYRDWSRDMVIRRPGEMAISIPWGGSLGRYSYWTPFAEESDCSRAPCAMDWVPASGQEQIYYMLEQGVKVYCKP